jgi:hypothetical protein
MILYGASYQFVPVSCFLFVLSPHVAGHCEILSDIFFTKFYAIRTNITDSVFYSTKCIIWEILRRLTPRSARRDHASASYGRSNLTRRDFDLTVFSGKVRVAATAHNKLSSLLYRMISNRPGSKYNIMEIFAKQIGTDFVTLEFSNMRATGYRF